MKLSNHLTTAPLTNPITHGAALLASGFMLIVLICKSFRRFYFVKEISIKKSRAIGTLFMCIASFVLKTYWRRINVNVKACMARLRNQVQILNGVVQFVSVNMVDNFLRKRKQSPAKMPFHNKSVLRSALAIYLKNAIAALDRAFAIQCPSIIRVSVSPLSLVVNTTKTLRETFLTAVWNRANIHPPILTPFNIVSTPFHS